MSAYDLCANDALSGSRWTAICVMAAPGCAARAPAERSRLGSLFQSVTESAQAGLAAAARANRNGVRSVRAALNRA